MLNFRVAWDRINEVYYLYHCPLGCDWEYDLPATAPILKELIDLAKAHEKECVR
jgi:hypothetical protein